jgi:hypothetical protein
LVTTAVGSGTAALLVTETDPPALHGPPTAALGGSLALSAGAAPSGYAWLAASLAPGPTPVPGLFDLEIGGGDLLGIALVGSLALGPAGTGTKTLALPAAPSLSGAALWLEAVTLDPGAAGLETTPALGVVLQ